MSCLYWSCSNDVKEDVLRLLAEYDPDTTVLGSGNGMPIISISSPDPEALRLTVDLLAQKRIVSAALMSGPLVEDELWIAAEWLERVVVERTEVSRMESVLNRLRPEREHSERSLVVFRLLEKVMPTPGEADVLTQDEEGVAGAHVREDPYKYYGDLADPLTGGASALYAAGFEAARARGLLDDRIVVASPEALGFELDTGKNSVVAWQKKSTISVEAVGFSRGSIREAAHVSTLFAHPLNDVDFHDLERKFDAWRKEELSYAVALVLRGLQDPPVVIPVGSVYQQPCIGSKEQNLAIAKPASTVVAAGATVPLILPAWCLNRTSWPPNGRLVPTPLIAAAAGGTQEEVWERIDDRYRGGL